jgi:hypothetical protein
MAMTVTSFMPVRKHMQLKTWKLLHKSGMYFLWAYAFSVYWWNLFYYASPVAIDYVYYWGGFLAWVLRAAAWSKKRRQREEKQAVHRQGQPALRLLGYMVIGIGLLAASFGLAWQKTAEQYLTGYTITYWPETYLPYWPFEPFLPLFIIALGTYLLTEFRSIFPSATRLSRAG